MFREKQNDVEKKNNRNEEEIRLEEKVRRRLKEEGRNSNQKQGIKMEGITAPDLPSIIQSVSIYLRTTARCIRTLRLCRCV